MSVKRIECGWAGHFICANDCLFRRNTHLERNGVSIVVSTVGNMVSPITKEIEEVGWNRYSETMVFFSGDNEYQDADVSKQIHLNETWCLGKTDDWKINEMHENAVNEITERMEAGEFDD